MVTVKKEERKKDIIELLLSEGTQSFSEIFEKIGKGYQIIIYNNGKESKIPKDAEIPKVAKLHKKVTSYSKTYLTNYLNELIQDGIIGIIKEQGHKKYVLSKQAFGETYEVFLKLFLKLKERKQKFPEFLKNIEEWEDVQEELLFRNISDWILYYLNLYLTMVELTVNAPRKLQGLSSVFLAQVTEEFLRVLSVFGNKDAQATNKVLEQIKEKMLSMHQGLPS